jgi:cell division protein FtsL
MKRRVRPSRPPSRLLQSTLALTIVTLGFVTLMVRLEVTEEGYRLSTLESKLAQEREANRRLRLEAAELGSLPRLRALAVKYGLSSPERGQVVMIP